MPIVQAWIGHSAKAESVVKVEKIVELPNINAFKEVNQIFVM